MKVGAGMVLGLGPGSEAGTAAEGSAKAEVCRRVITVESRYVRG
jgi:hypothetical protein